MQPSSSSSSSAAASAASSAASSASASAAAAAAASAAPPAARPVAGVYVRGIWVRKPLIEGAIMAFWSKLNVSSRDRNDVDAEECADATLAVLRDAARSEAGKAALRRLLAPLQGKKAGSSASGGGSWLLRTPRFTNRLLEAHRPFFLGALGMPAGALFVSRRTTESGDPFLKWAAAFLARRGAPLLPLEPGASKALFSEASEDELQERCVKELLAELKKAPAARTDAQQAAAKLLAFVGAESRSLRLHFSALVAVPFAHGAHVFMPATALDRGLLLRLLATLQKRLGRFDDKCVHATQAFFETLPAHGGLSLPQLDAALSRAKQVGVESRAFERRLEVGGVGGAAAAPAAAGPSRGGGQPPPVISLDDDGAAGGAADRRGGGGTAGGEESRRALERQIAAAARQRQTLRAGHILPAAAFADEANESEEKCLRAGHDALKAVAAHDSVGGGEVYSDVASAAHLAAGTLPKAAQLKALRAHLEQAKRTLAAALPSLGSLLEGAVKAGFDVGGAYLGFCSERAIVVKPRAAAAPLERGGHARRAAPHPRSRGGAPPQQGRRARQRVAAYDELIQAAIVAGVGPAPGAFAGVRVGRRA